MLKTRKLNLRVIQICCPPAEWNEKGSVFMPASSRVSHFYQFIVFPSSTPVGGLFASGKPTICYIRSNCKDFS